LVDNPCYADAAFVFIESPQSGTGYSKADVNAGGNGYVPISLMYGKYTDENAIATSIAGGSELENFTNRSYRGKIATAQNSFAITMVNETCVKIGKKPWLTLRALAFIRE
jgi:beta-glucosidase